MLGRLNTAQPPSYLILYAREREEANVKCESSFDAVQSQSFDVPRDLILVSIQSPCKLCSRPSKVGE